MDDPTPAGVPEAILVPRGGKPMLPSRPAIAVRPRRSTLLVGILLCLIVALALILLIVAPALAQKKLAKEGEELVRHMDGSVAPVKSQLTREQKTIRRSTKEYEAGPPISCVTC